jgi:hypothetical protein
MSGLAVADFNGDRTPDLALAGSREVVLLFGHGDGTFRTRVVSRRVPDARELKAVDLNGDRRPDLVMVGFEGVGTAVLINQGTGHFRLDHLYLRHGGAESAVPADVDRDGIKDLVTASAVRQVSPTTLLGTGGGRFRISPGRGSAYADALDAGDVDGDGDVDVVLADENDVIVYSGNGNGIFTRMHAYAAPGSTTVRLCDINHDGKLDLATQPDTDTEPPDAMLAVRLGDGDGTFGDEKDTFIGGGGVSYNAGSFADLDGDGNLDFVTGRGPGSQSITRRGRGDGTFMNPQGFRARSEGHSAVADFNRDGLPDVAFVNEHFASRAGGVDIVFNWTHGAAPPCVVHTLVAAQLPAAKRDLSASGCRLGRVRYRRSRTLHANRVIAQRPSGARVLHSHARVDLIVAEG